MDGLGIGQNRKRSRPNACPKRFLTLTQNNQYDPEENASSPRLRRSCSFMAQDSNSINSMISVKFSMMGLTTGGGAGNKIVVDLHG